MDKLIEIAEAVKKIQSGCTLMIGGFGQGGSPRNLIAALAESGVRELHTISDDLGVTSRGFNQTISQLVENGQISSAKCCFIGQNPDAGRKYIKGELDIEFIPIGTMAERIRAGGSGIGGFYTKTGVDTLAARGKEVRIIDGEKYVFEKPLRADVAIIKAFRADRYGNAVFRYSAQNYNAVMATAADVVILEAEEVVDAGEIHPDEVQLPGIFIDYVVCERGDVL